MATDYDRIAEDYRRCKTQGWRTYIEAYTYPKLLGDLTGKSVLDLACGEGFLTRTLHRLGAASLTGADLSAEMVALARQQEAVEPMGIEYVVGDGRTLNLGKRFDVVTASYLLNYARTEIELREMVATIARHLKPGGRFVGLNNNPSQPHAAFAMPQYGFVKIGSDKPVEGSPVVFRIFLDGRVLDIENYHLEPATHERAFADAGMTALRWVRPEVSPKADPKPETGFWNAFLDAPPVIFLESFASQ